MFLLGKKKARPCSIRYPFGKTPPPPITDERLAELVVRLKAGDKGVIDEIVSGHLRLAVYVASCYAALEPRKAKDLVGESSLALVKACHDIMQMNLDSSFAKFATYRMHEACGHYLRADRLIPLTRHAKYAIKEKEKKIVTNKEIIGQTISPLSKMILDEKIHLAVRTDEERKVFDLRVEGYNFREIKELTGISEATAYRLIENVKSRFLRGEQDEEA